MSLLTDLPKLNEMEQKASPAPWRVSKMDRPDTILFKELRNAAPAMFEVLSRFQKDDAIGLNQVASYIELYVIERQDQESKRAHWVELAVMLRRLQEAARRMVE